MKFGRGLRILFAINFIALFAVGCSNELEPGAARLLRPAPSQEVLRLATTTSTRDSGLLDELLPAFRQEHNCRVDVVAVGSGAALKLGETGDVDVVMVHARQAEDEFMEAKHGIRHEEFMYNEFVLLGPANDPAQTRAVEIVPAMRRIAGNESKFISRGDDSGTHQRELELWSEASVRPAWPGYLEAGQGMGPALVMADEKQAYVLADRGTYLNFRHRIDLVPLATSAQLRNPYSAITVNPDEHSHVNAVLADAFVDFLIGETAQRLIANYQVAGEQLFYPTRLGDNK